MNARLLNKGLFILLGEEELGGLQHSLSHIRPLRLDGCYWKKRDHALLLWCGV